MFLLTESTNLDIIGKEYPQIQELGLEYDIYSERGLRLIDYDKPIDYELKLNSFLVRRHSNNNLPILIILFPLLCVEFLLNNPLFHK